MKNKTVHYSLLNYVTKTRKFPNNVPSFYLGRLSLRSSLSLNTFHPTKYLVLYAVHHVRQFCLLTGFHNRELYPTEDSFVDYRETRPLVLERSHLLRTFSQTPRLYSRTFPLPFPPSPDALSGPNFWLRARARMGADATVRAAKYHAGSWPRQSTAINLKKGGQTELPLFTCTRRRLRPRIGRS